MDTVPPIGLTRPGRPRRSSPHAASGKAPVGRPIATVWQNPAMPRVPARRIPPPGLLLFLGYAILVLGIVGVSLRWVIDQAIAAPLSVTGLAVMALLAYTIFSITMVIQRKQAARGLALGLSTLTIPAVPLLLLSPVPPVAIVPALLGVLLFVGLSRPAVREWLTEE
jgi:hypothetical protein